MNPISSARKNKNNKHDKTQTVPSAALTDTPAKHGDISLNVQGYLDGFANFIKKCDTPMTIAIQGDWGTGKTTSMEYLIWKLGGTHDAKDGSGDGGEADDRERDIVLSFNTWQYSQFNLGDQLAHTLLLGIFSQLHEQVDAGKASKESNLVWNALKNVMRCSLPLVRAAANMGGVGLMYDAVKGVATTAKELKDESKNNDDFPEDNTPVKALSQLKSAFEQYIWTVACINPEAEEKRYRKIYIMIDDLDRLNPARAVEVMEALKIFLNVEHCVFVMAIDFNVVLRGVKDKYGADFGEDKARAFFDKIIQIPFNLPTGAYQLKPYVEQCAPQRDWNDDALISKYVDYLQCTVGANPRSVKRIFNTFKLMDDIAAAHDNDIENGSDRAGTFAILCFQNGYPRVFEDLLMDMGAGVPSVEYIVKLRDAASSMAGANRRSVHTDDSMADDSYVAKLSDWGYEDYRIAVLGNLLNLMIDEFGIPDTATDGDGDKDSEDRLSSAEDRLQQALAQAAVTSVRANTQSDQSVLNVREMNAEERRRSYGDNSQISDEQEKLLNAFEDVLAQRKTFKALGSSQKSSRKIAFKAAKDDMSIREEFRGVQFMAVQYTKDPNYLRVNLGNRLTRTGLSKDEAEQLQEAWVKRIKECLAGNQGEINVTVSSVDAPDPIHINRIATPEQAKAIAEVLLDICMGQGDE